MQDIDHIRVKEEYAASLIEHLISQNAIEDLNNLELSNSQKEALDTELEKIAGDADYLKNWNEVKSQFKKC